MRCYLDVLQILTTQLPIFLILPSIIIVIDSHSPSAKALVPRRSSCKMWSGAQSPLPPQLGVMELKLRLPDFSILLLIMVTILTSDHGYFIYRYGCSPSINPYSQVGSRILIYRQYYIRLSTENCNRELLTLDTPARLCTLTISTLFQLKMTSIKPSHRISLILLHSTQIFSISFFCRIIVSIPFSEPLMSINEFCQNTV